MNKYLQLYIFLFLACVSFNLSAQDEHIYGKVTDRNDKPVYGVSIVNRYTGAGTTTDFNGNFTLYMTPGRMNVVEFSYIGKETQIEEFYLRRGDVREINVTFWDLDIVLDEVVVRSTIYRPPTRTAVKLNPREFESIPTVSGNIEDILPMLGGTVSNNELSSQYSVRGGNYDENLVYVNDFQVYRPFLVRAGQQEGLSFINPDLVQGLEFSAGGFEAKYGDKLSSVLDVRYKNPKAGTSSGSAYASLLGVGAHIEGANSGGNLSYLAGVRHKSNKYLLNSLPVQGAYNPSFTDFQALVTYKFDEAWELQWLTNYARNRYELAPDSSRTSFGTFNDALELRVFFEGQERDRYTNWMNGLSLNYTSDDARLKLKFMGSFYDINEIEAFDIEGAYLIGSVETDFSQEDVGEINTVLGVGVYHDFARNQLKSNISNVGHRGYLDINSGEHFLRWGLDFQHEEIEDRLNEWFTTDSSRYNIPYHGTEVRLNEVLKTDISLSSNRLMGFIQDDFSLYTGENDELAVSAGVRFNYWDLNKELLLSPRIQIGYSPELKNFKFDPEKHLVEHRWNLRLAGGLYQQPAFYRELRNFEGEINRDLKAQKSLHVVLGSDYIFNMWKRPFKFTTELYYKEMWDLVPYDLDNLLIRYFAENKAVGYAGGIDFRLNGEFVPGTDSWISLSVMQTKEDLKDDFYLQFLNAAGEDILRSDDREIVDTLNVEVGYVRRPTDQRVTFGMFFQDHIPGNEKLKMHLRLLFGSGLSTNPPNSNPRLRGFFKIPSYRRIDIGFSAMLFDFDKMRRQMYEKHPLRRFQSVWASLEIFNLLGVNNTVSYSYIKALAANGSGEVIYSVPNQLTARRVNLRMVVKF